MLPRSVLAGLIVIVSVPPPVTFHDVTSIVSTVEWSEIFLIKIFPVPTDTVSVNVRTRLPFTPTLTAPSIGERVEMVGGVVSQPPPHSHVPV